MTLICPLCDLTLRYVLQLRDSVELPQCSRAASHTMDFLVLLTQLMPQAILAHLEGDIGLELRASGFEREHEITLEQWAVQQPAEQEDTTGATAVEPISDSEEGTSDSAASSSEGKEDVSCERFSRPHSSGESDSKPHSLEDVQQRLRSAEVSGTQGNELRLSRFTALQHCLVP